MNTTTTILCPALQRIAAAGVEVEVDELEPVPPALLAQHDRRAARLQAHGIAHDVSHSVTLWRTAARLGYQAAVYGWKYGGYGPGYRERMRRLRREVAATVRASRAGQEVPA